MQIKLQPLNSIIRDDDGLFSFYVLLELFPAQVNDFRQHVPGVSWLKNLTKLTLSKKREKVGLHTKVFQKSSIFFVVKCLFGQKQPIKVHIFEIFKCYGENLSNSSCKFLTDK